MAAWGRSRAQDTFTWIALDVSAIRVRCLGHPLSARTCGDMATSEVQGIAIAIANHLAPEGAATVGVSDSMHVVWVAQKEYTPKRQLRQALHIVHNSMNTVYHIAGNDSRVSNVMFRNVRCALPGKMCFPQDALVMYILLRRVVLG